MGGLAEKHVAREPGAASLAVNPEMPGPLVQVLAAGVDIEVAAGVADRATGTPLEPGMLFRICLLTGSSKPESRNQSAQTSPVRTGIPTISGIRLT
jgi:hypothetical protein